MEHRDGGSPPVLLVRCIVAVRKFISVFYAVPNIWFGVDGNSGATSKILSLHVHDSLKNRSDGTESERFVHFAFDICTR